MQGRGGDRLVTPRPLRHLNLDAQQPSAAQEIEKELRMDRQVVGTEKVLDKVMAKLGA